MNKVEYFIISAWLIGFLILAIGMWVLNGLAASIITFGLGVLGLLFVIPLVLVCEDLYNTEE